MTELPDFPASLPTPRPSWRERVNIRLHVGRDLHIHLGHHPSPASSSILPQLEEGDTDTGEAKYTIGAGVVLCLLAAKVEAVLKLLGW